mgnify:CR=1 FL=1
MRDFQQYITEGVYDPNIFKAFFLAGGPGSGKSWVSERTLSGMGLKIINSDNAFSRALEKEKQMGLMGMASGQLQSANQAVAAAQAQKKAGLSQIVGGVASGLTGGIGGKLMGKLGGAFNKTGLGKWLNKPPTGGPA